MRLWVTSLVHLAHDIRAALPIARARRTENAKTLAYLQSIRDTPTPRITDQQLWDLIDQENKC